MLLEKIKNNLAHFFSTYRKNLLFIALSALASIAVALLVELFFFNSSLFPGEFYFFWSRFWALAIILFVFIILAYYRKFFLAHLDKAFLMLAIPFGFLFIVVLPRTVYVSQDDQIHLQNAYVFLSSGEVSWSDAFRTLELSATTPENLSPAATEELYSNLNAQHEATKDKTRTFGEIPMAYTRLVYLPFFIGFQVSEFFHLNFTTMIIVAKLCNFLCYVLLMYFAIKISTSGKKIFFVLALLLSNMFYASQFSYDPLITASLTLAFALFLRMLELRKIPPLYSLGFLLLIVWASLPKAIYCFMLLLVFFIPNRNFDHPRRARAYKIAATALMLLLIATFALPLISGGGGIDFRGGDVSAGRQISYILHNPFSFAFTFSKYLVNVFPNLFLSQATTVGIYMPYSYTELILPIINLAYIFLLGYVVFTSKKSDSFTLPSRLATIFIYLFLACVIIGTLYLTFSPVGSPTIEGVQTRYFLPILPLLLVFLIPKCQNSKGLSSSCSNYAILAIPYLSLALFLGTCILRLSLM